MNTNARKYGQKLNKLVSDGDYDFKEAQRLIEKGANLEIADNRGLRVLHHAAIHNDFALISLLLEQGAEVDAKDGYDNTPLKLATRERNFKDKNIPQLFYKHDADDSQIDETQYRLRSRLRKPTNGTTQTTNLSVTTQRSNSPQKKILSKNKVDLAWKQIQEIFLSPKEPLKFRTILEKKKHDCSFTCNSKRDNKIIQESIEHIQSDNFQVFEDGSNLEQIGEREPIVYLYLALGYSTKIDDFFDDLRDTLEKYKSQLEEQNTPFSPLFFLAQARLAIATKDQELAHHCFFLFQKYTTSTVQRQWLHKNESYPEPASSKSPKEDSKPTKDPIKAKWTQLKKKLKGDESKVAPMEELLELIGLESVKTIALNIYSKILADQALPEEARVPVRLNFSFMGNPGTGKTTVARIFGKLIHASGARGRTDEDDSEEEIFVATTAQKLISAGAASFEKTIEEAMGGVLFIDEAYALSPKDNKIGQSIIDQILTAAEDHRQELSIILAGYKNDIEDKVYGYNIGLKSRFTDVYFDDFDIDSLREIWDGMLKKYNPNNEGWRVESDNVSKIAILRVARGIGRKGFGNARAVRNLFERSINFAQVRGASSPPTLKLIDIIGPEPSRTNIPELDKALRDLERQVGLKTVKENIYQLIEMVAENYELEKQGKAPQPIALNRLFVGNPGTGKTTVAAIYGRILQSLRLLSDGAVEYKTASDFVGSFVGESQKTTSNILALCQGKVLVIDEAYNLNDNMYGKQVLDTIVEKVSGKPGEDIAIIMCGYQREMDEMLSNQNPGLKRRFNPDEKFIFEDFDNESLSIIMKRACNKLDVPISSSLIRKAVMELAKKRAMPHFGNAGAVISMLSSAQIKRATRLRENRELSKLMIEEDLFGQDTQQNPFNILNELENVDSIRTQLEEMYKVLEVWKREGGAKPKIGNYRFIGNAGTGKTTIARLMGTIFNSMGVLARDHVEETSGKGLTGNVVGATKDIVEAKMQAAAGGILFIDEAYDLGKGVYGEEAMTTLLRLLTDPRYNNDQTIVILAGYEREIEAMMERNQGMNSRFSNTIRFEDWTPESCTSLLKNLAKVDKIQMSEESTSQLNEGFQTLLSLNKWGNARDVKSLYEQLRRKRSLRVYDSPETEARFVSSDIAQALEEFIGERGERVSSIPVIQELPDAEYAVATETQQSAPISIRQKVEQKEAPITEIATSIERTEEDKQEEEELRKTFSDLFANLDSDILERRGSLGERSLEGILEEMNYVGLDSLDELLDDGMANENLQEAMRRLVDTLIEQGVGLEEAKKRVEDAVTDWLGAKREAKRLQEELELREREASRIAVYVCGYCGRRWGVCTYLGPTFLRWEYPNG